ncbi:MAG: hypothetical protein M1825_003068 [Sarcosagium campestre]|nr:MAG: hypothetical protein M1825_003068 [Sarcosagium campestre]
MTGFGNPISWDQYEHGQCGRQSSISSSSSHIHFDETSPASSSQHLNSPGRGRRPEQDNQELRRRRSSLSTGLDSIRHAGGPNSIENFARSWQRAAGFYEITPHRNSFVLTDDETENPADDFRRRHDTEHGFPRQSLLRAEIERRASSSEEAVEEYDDSQDPTSSKHGEAEATTAKRISSKASDENIFAIAPHLASPFAASYGTSYGTLSTRINESSMRHAGRLWQQQQDTGVNEPDKERAPLLVRQIEREDGKIVNVVIGQSTLPQTVFNSVNVLIGVGLLSLPLGFKYSGWSIGILFLLFAALATSYTARIMAKCLDVDRTLITYADLAYISFGPRARVLTSILFSVELMAPCVALVVLCADSLNALIPDIGLTEWKLVCGLILLPLSFMPLQILSFSSALGILCCLGRKIFQTSNDDVRRLTLSAVVVIVFINGFLKPHQPGSLLEPAVTYWFPSTWLTIPLSFGLLISPWGGHGVFPNIYRDMRHPQKYKKGVRITFAFTFLLDLSMAAAGLLMFGDDVRDEVTSNILLTEGYPQAFKICIIVFIAIIPLTKIPLNTRPVVSTIEIFSGLDARAISNDQALVGMSAITRGALKVTIRVLTIAIFVAISILFPSFDRIMALSGSATCFTICIILPLSFYLKIFGNDISLKERILDYFLIISCSIMAVLGTVWACLPKELIGAT